MDSTLHAETPQFTHHKTDTDTLAAGEAPSAKNYAASRSRLSRRGRGAPPRPNLPGGSVHQRSIVRIGVPLAVAALALTACGSRGDSGTSSGGSTAAAPRRRSRSASSRRSPATCRPSARASSTPSSSPSSRPTTPTPSPGWKLEVSSVDDEAKADVGKNAATKLAADDAGHRRRRRPQLQRQPADPADLRGGQHHPDLAGQHQPEPDHRRGRREPRSGRTRRTSAPAPRTRSRARSPRSTSWRRASRTSRRSTTRRPTARVSSTRSPRSSRRAAAPSSRPRPSTPTSRTTRPSCPRSPRRSRRPSTTAASTRRAARSRSR